MDRLIDYFIVVGYGDVLKPLKNNIYNTQSYYQANVTDRYPLLDYPDSPLPDSMAMFCIPDGIKLTNSPDLPIFYNFANTLQNGVRLYGSCLKFFEPISEEILDQLTSDCIDSPKHRSISISSLNNISNDINNNRTIKRMSSKITDKNLQLYAAKCICILSHWPFFDSFRTFLTSLYRTSLTPTNICIESYLCNLMFEVPLPPPGKIQVQYNINGTSIYFKRPPPNNPLAFVDFNLAWIFRELNVEYIIKVVECLLTEGQVLVISSHYSMLTIAAESFLALLYPFVWRYVYIPFLPQIAIDFLNAPLPFLVGTHSSFIDKSSVSESICLVDLDDNIIRLPVVQNEHTHPSHITLPDRERAKLSEQLNEMVPPVLKNKNSASVADLDLAFANAAPPDEYDDLEEKKSLPSFELRYSFFRCFLSIFRSYRDFLSPPASNNKNSTSNLFNTAEFIRQNPASERFLTSFCSTQAFQKFVEDRIYLSPQTESDVFYFDQSVIAKLNRSFFSRHNDTPFLTDPTFEISKTFIAMAPDTFHQPPSASFNYVRWPQLDFSLFYPSRLINSPFQSDQIRSQQSVISYKKSNAFGFNPVTYTNPKGLLMRSASELSVYSLWFYLYGASLRKSASLFELIPAYDVYCRMRTEAFVVDDSTYKIILESCGKAGTPDLAFYILKDMKLAGLTPDASVYTAIISTLDSNNHAVDGHCDTSMTQLHDDVHKSVFSSKQINPEDILGQSYNPSSPNFGSSSPSANPYSPSASLVSPAYVNHLSTDLVADTNLFFSVYSEENKLAARKSLGMPASTQSDYYVSIFEMAFPKLTITTADYCMECSQSVVDHEIRSGWTMDNNDYTTQCPHCSCRFVARFSIKPKGVEDESKLISCEYLSPLVLRKEVENILVRESPEFLVSKEFRKNSVTCFWNLAWHLSNLQLPMEGILIPVVSVTQAVAMTVGNEHRDSITSNFKYMHKTK